MSFYFTCYKRYKRNGRKGWILGKTRWDLGEGGGWRSYHNTVEIQSKPGIISSGSPHPWNGTRVLDTYRSKEHGLGWVVEIQPDNNPRHAWILVFFFDKPEMLIQEIKAAEFNQRKKRKRK